MTLFQDIIGTKSEAPLPQKEGMLQCKKRTVLNAVRGCTEKEGLTIREVAEICDMSVYAARNWLLKLEQEGLIYKSCRPRNSTWHAF